jgi:hypothetical protein
VVQPAPEGHQLAVDMSHGYLLGLFPVNVLHNVLHLLIGAWGLLSSRSLSAARTYARGLAIFYGLLAVLGLIPHTNALFGLVPIHGHDVWLHAGSAPVAAYFGFMAPATDRADAAADASGTHAAGT